MRKFIRSLLMLFGGLFVLLVTYIPGDIGAALRKRYWRRRLGKLGDGARIEPGVFFERPELIFIDDRVLIGQGATFLAGKPVAGGRRIIRGKSTVEEGHLYIGKNVHVLAYATLSGIGGLRIGNNTHIGAKASVYSYTQVTLEPNVLYVASINIGDNVVIGTNASVICVGEIADGSVISPNSFLSGVLSRAFESTQDLEDACSEDQRYLCRYAGAEPGTPGTNNRAGVSGGSPFEHHRSASCGLPGVRPDVSGSERTESPWGISTTSFRTASAFATPTSSSYSGKSVA